jgi:anthranilate phosphoribosyltransferase
LINPFGAPNGLVGVFHGPVLERVAAAMQRQGYQRGIAVQGTEGAIDVLTSRRTPLIEFVGDSGLQPWSIDPAQHGGWLEAGEAHLPVTAPTNADLTRRILAPNPTFSGLEAFRRAALLTAALMIYASGKATAYAEAIESAESALLSGDAAARLSRWQTRSMQLSDRKTEVNCVR